jgi:hypothetical protein
MWSLEGEMGALHFKERAGKRDAQAVAARRMAGLVRAGTGRIAARHRHLGRNLDARCAADPAAPGRYRPARRRVRHRFAQQKLQRLAARLPIAVDLDGTAILHAQPRFTPHPGS